ncbi:MAG: hypothetical protein RL758_249 [Pseudomonadota bacterium]|jgi:hypothetical protein
MTPDLCDARAASRQWEEICARDDEWSLANELLRDGIRDEFENFLLGTDKDQVACGELVLLGKSFYTEPLTDVINRHVYDDEVSEAILNILRKDAGQYAQALRTALGRAHANQCEVLSCE